MRRASEMRITPLNHGTQIEHPQKACIDNLLSLIKWSSRFHYIMFIIMVVVDMTFVDMTFVDVAPHTRWIIIHSNTCTDYSNNTDNIIDVSHEYDLYVGSSVSVAYTKKSFPFEHIEVTIAYDNDNDQINYMPENPSM